MLFAIPAAGGPLEPMRPPPEPPDNRATAGKVALGKMLFFDRRLSGDGTMSCATCHIPELCFTDGQRLSLSYPATRHWRNTPTVVNAAFRAVLFHDGRAATLEDQALLPVAAPFEMNMNRDFLVERLRAVPEYVEAFRTSFGGEPDAARLAMAIAAFERTLVSRNAPIDRYLAGDNAALGAEAAEGYRIFTGKGRCDRCHGGALLSDDGFHALGVPGIAEDSDDRQIAVTRRFAAKAAGLDDYRTLSEDPGRFLVTRSARDWKAFRTPSLREVAKTAPYMHNGVFADLDAVIDFVDRGGGSGNKELSPLGLTAAEKRSLKAFLVEALSGDDLVVRAPEIP